MRRMRAGSSRVRPRPRRVALRREQRAAHPEIQARRPPRGRAPVRTLDGAGRRGTDRGRGPDRAGPAASLAPAAARLQPVGPARAEDCRTMRALLDTGHFARRSATVSQQGLGATARQQNVKAGAFRVCRPERIAGARILLVDDVLTTGATVAACTTVLAARGCRRGRCPDAGAGGQGGDITYMIVVLRHGDVARQSLRVLRCPWSRSTRRPCAPTASGRSVCSRTRGSSSSRSTSGMSPGRRDEMIARAGGRRTVPQVFVDGRGLGGSDEIHALDRQGGLDPLLAASSAAHRAEGVSDDLLRAALRQRPHL